MSSHQNPHHSWVDVLIVGAGPAGLMSANALSRMGVNLRIVDKRPHKLAAGQADGIQPRTIEVLQSYGLAERLLKEGNQMHVAAFYNPSADGGIERINRAPDVTAPTARFPFEVTLHQGAIESIFVDSLREYGVTVRRHTLPLSLELSRDPAKLRDPHSYPITVSLSDLDNPHSEPEIVHAKYLVGADGAHSWVRRTCGIEMEGEDTEYVWGVLDIYPDTDFPDIRNRTAIHSNNGACMIIPREGDKVRLYVQLNRDAHLASAGEPITKDVMTFDKIMKVAKKSFAPYRIDHTGEPEWWSIYKIRQQVANRFSLHERIFIAGDACHTHSPKAGQGMNASMNDSHNLAWKLTHVLRGWADLSLLKTYEFERRKYAQDLIAFDRKFAALFSGAAAAAGDTAAMGVSHEQFLQVFQTFGGFTSGIGIHYAPSSLVHPQQQGCMPGLVVGQRVIPSVVLRAADSRPYEIQDLLPSDGKHKLLVFCGPANDQRMQESMRALNAALGKRMWPAGGREAMMDVLVFCQGKTREVNWTDVAPSFKLHWTKVFVDDVCAAGRIGGHLYETYGVGTEGAVAIIRPDGYVGSVFPLAQAEGVDSYFSAALGLKSNSESEMSQARL